MALSLNIHQRATQQQLNRKELQETFFLKRRRAVFHCIKEKGWSST